MTNDRDEARIHPLGHDNRSETQKRADLHKDDFAGYAAPLVARLSVDQADVVAQAAKQEQRAAYQQRAIRERQELGGKIDAQTAFKRSHTYDALDAYDRALLDEQLSHMWGYYEAIGKRIGHWGNLEEQRAEEARKQEHQRRADAAASRGAQEALKVHERGQVMCTIPLIHPALGAQAQEKLLGSLSMAITKGMPTLVTNDRGEDIGVIVGAVRAEGGTLVADIRLTQGITLHAKHGNASYEFRPGTPEEVLVRAHQSMAGQKAWEPLTDTTPRPSHYSATEVRATAPEGHPNEDTFGGLKE